MLKRIGYKLMPNSMFRMIVKAADAGVPWAKEQLGKMSQYNDPNFMYRVSMARVQVYKSDAYNGNSKAQYWYGFSLQGIDNNESLRFLIPLAEAGNTDAMTAIAYGYGPYGGYGEDESEYFKWHLKAAIAGDIFSQNQVALKYKVDQDYENAFYWYEQSASQNSSKGFCGMADCLVIKKMKLSSQNDNETKKEINMLNAKIENFYNLALDNVINADEDQEACWGIASFYRSCSYDAENNQTKYILLKRAIYYYMCSYSCGNPYGLKNAKEIAEENGIQVDFNNIEKWAEYESLNNSTVFYEKKVETKHNNIKQGQSIDEKNENTNITYTIDEIVLTLNEAFSGCVKKTKIIYHIPCTLCSGTGSKSKESGVLKCSKCEGKGRVLITVTTLSKKSESVQNCPKCHGSGKIITNKCINCHGKGYHEKIDYLNVKVPSGIDNMQGIRVDNKVVQIKVKNDSTFERRGMDLFSSITISNKTAINGGNVVVDTIDGRVNLNIKPGIKSGTKLRLKGKGMPNLQTKERGDLYVKVRY